MHPLFSVFGDLKTFISVLGFEVWSRQAGSPPLYRLAAWEPRQEDSEEGCGFSRGEWYDCLVLSALGTGEGRWHLGKELPTWV